MDDKRDGKKKEKKRSRSRSRSRDTKRRSPSRSPSYGRRRRDRSRSRDRQRRRTRSPEMRRRGRGRRSPSPPPPPTIQAPPPPMIASGVPPAGYAMYDAYGGYSAPAPGAYMGDMSQQYGGYEYRAPPGPAPVAVDGYGGMLSGPPPQIMMVGQPGPPGEDYNAAAVAAAGWSAPPPALPVVQETDEEKRKREAAIASEVRNQRASLKKQRDDYKQRAGALKRELKILKQQRTDLSSGREPPSPTTNSFIKENDKLQSQIQTKLSTIENVIDMLEGIIGKDKTPTPPPPPISRTPERTTTTAATGLGDSPPPTGKERKGSVSSSASPERLKNEVLETMKRGKARKEDKSTIKQEKSDDPKPVSQVNNVFYDPELHWCATCDIFPKTAKDYLNHLHTEQHLTKAAAAVQDYPWRDKLPDADEPQNNPALPPKRTPIRGLQFFVPAPAWYCKLCNYWMGDLHCASMHLKSTKHREHYGQFIENHANFEIDWMSDRQKAYERMRDSDRHGNAASTTTPYAPDSVPSMKGEVDFLTGNLLSKDAATGKAKKKSKKEDKKDKKKKKRSKKKKKRASSSSSSSSDSDSDLDKKSAKGDEFDPATSIRVAMRNILKAQEAASKETKQAEEAAAGKWTVVQPAVPPKELTAPPPPFMTDGAESREKKRDELMISQWVTPDPIISEKEKQMLEQLKGKLKKRDDGPPPPGPPGNRFQEPERDNFHREVDERRRSKSVTPPWRRNRSPARRGSPGFGRGRRSPPDRRVRGRDSRDRDMNRGGMGGGRFDRRRGRRSPSPSPPRSPGGRFDRRRGSPMGRFDRRRSPSPNFGRGRFRPRRSFSRSRSRSRGRRVIEKPVVNFPPEPKPKPAKKTRDKKDDDKKEKKPVSMSISGQKKLPFIGRMPVFKKQQQDAKKEEPSAMEQTDMELSASQENGTKPQPEEFVDMMPDPYQYAAMCAPPPPPSGHPGKPDQNILPPGIDEAEADHVPKPISDAPIPRKGPLPKDFQQALDILFDGDKPKPAEVIANETKPPELPPPPPVAPPIDTDQPQMIVPEAIEIYNQQIAAQYSTAVVSGAAVSYDDESQNQPLEMATTVKSESKSPPIESTPASNPASEEDSETKNGASEPEAPAPPKIEVENEETRRKRAELEELAMLGIDADDMAAQIF